MIRHLPLLLILLSGAATPLAAVQSASPDLSGAEPARAISDARTYDGRRGELEVTTPKVADPGIDVDGVLDEEVWSRAALLRGFTQFEPSEDIPGSEETEILVFVSDDAIYFGVRAHDSRADRIRATLAERDEFTRSDDYVRFLLDTFDDQRKAYVFTVNPYGVQHDGLWIEGGETHGFGPPIDSNPDFIWASGARIDEGGWTAEVRIPFKSLRFREVPVQAWGLNVMRSIQRAGFEQSWAPVGQAVANRLSQSGRLTDLRDLDPGMFLEINPVATASRVGAFEEEAGGLVHDGVEPEIGVNVTYGLTSNLTLDGTINPDFSQVEADAGQIAVNERFALFFPEKRPFFLEGTEIFSLPSQLIFTRTIVDPIAGAKVTGKVGGLSLGYLGAIDQAGEGEDAKVNFLRLRHDLGTSSNVGMLYTDRTRTGDDFNRVGGADARFVIGGRYTLTLLGAASWTSDPGTETLSDTYVSAELRRAGRGFSYGIGLEDHGTDFEAGSGFLRRVGETQVDGRLRFDFFGEPGDLLEAWGFGAESRGFWSHDDFWDGRGLREGEVELQASTSFRNNVFFRLAYTRGVFDFDADEYEGLFVDPAGETPFRPDQGLFADQDGLDLLVFFSPWEKVRGNLTLRWSEVPIFDRRLGVPVAPGAAWGGNVSLNLFPTTRLKADVGVRHQTIFRDRDGSRHSSATIPRIEAQYQFTRALFLRTILEYSAQEREELLDPETGRVVQRCDEGGCEPLDGSVSNDVHVEALLAYEPSPGTVFFLGYTRDLEEPEAFSFRELEARAEGLFLKLSYRLRF